jgi:hypothetical protein
MITVTISHTRFIVKTLEDAEALLRIFSTAKHVDREYDSGTGSHTFVYRTSETPIEISVYADQQILTPEEYAAKLTKAIKAVAVAS